MRHVEPDMPIHTFSYVARESTYDEESWADLVNKHVNAITHKVIVSPQELAQDLDDMIRVQGEPFGSTSIYAQYRVFKLARESGITVTLDGQGADEMLAGYNGYPGPTLHSLVEKRQWLAMMKFLQKWAQWPDRSIGAASKALIGEYTTKSLRSISSRSFIHNPFPNWLNASYFDRQNIWMHQSMKSDNNADVKGRRLMAALRKSLTGDGLNGLLRHGDRNSMRWSVESRVPFLTNDIAEFLLSLPEDYLISKHGETKHIFRAAMRGIVPDAILDRRDKVGFNTPEQAWLKQLGAQVYEWLDAAENMPFLNARSCREEVTSILNGYKPFNFQAWRLINFCRWSQLMK
mgnify:FL=1